MDIMEEAILSGHMAATENYKVGIGDYALSILGCAPIYHLKGDEAHIGALETFPDFPSHAVGNLYIIWKRTHHRASDRGLKGSPQVSGEAIGGI